MWDTSTGKVLLTAPGRERAVFSADSKFLIRRKTTASTDVWDARTGLPAQLRLPVNPWQPLAQLGPNGRLLALPIEAGKVLLWNTATGKVVATLRGHGSALAGLVFSADGHRLFTAGVDDAAVKVWDTESGQEICSLPMPGGRGGPLLLSPDGRQLACRGPEAVRVWDATPLGDDGGR
jgi:WD40 repeat protein